MDSNFIAEMKNLPREAKIAIMGAGAIGSVIGGMLARNGHKVTLVGRKLHIEEIMKNGLHISGIWGNYTAFRLIRNTFAPLLANGYKSIK